VYTSVLVRDRDRPLVLAIQPLVAEGKGQCARKRTDSPIAIMAAVMPTASSRLKTRQYVKMKPPDKEHHRKGHNGSGGLVRKR